MELIENYDIDAIYFIWIDARPGFSLIMSSTKEMN